ncbi:unnamed protein product [Linum trigynum]|uniref:Uncharacterized protein n=1 Tax=Linum trigynum TaxID=586398 RepID=A0AAV2DBN2_9ROSI
MQSNDSTKVGVPHRRCPSENIVVDAVPLRQIAPAHSNDDGLCHLSRESLIQLRKTRVTGSGGGGKVAEKQKQPPKGEIGKMKGNEPELDLKGVEKLIPNSESKPSKKIMSPGNRLK